MPTVYDEVETAKVDRRQLADILGVRPPNISRAAHKKYLCQGFPVHEWAVWHPRGNQVLHYQVPKPILRDLLPPSEHIIYGL